MCVNPFQRLRQLTDFYEILYGPYAIRDYFNPLISENGYYYNVRYQIDIVPLTVGREIMDGSGSLEICNFVKSPFCNS
jgi:hypothetical protein